MAIYVKCPQCGEEFNELIHSKCPRCGSIEYTENNEKFGRIVCPNKQCNAKISRLFEKCPICGCNLPNDLPVEIVKNDNYTDDESVNDEPMQYISSHSQFEVPTLYYLFFKDKGFNFGRLLATCLIEAVAGAIIVGIAFLLNPFEDYLARGMWVLAIGGIILVLHSFYTLIKYSVLLLLEMINVSISEMTTRFILFFTEILFGALFILLSMQLHYSADISEDVENAFDLLGAGLIVGAIWSLIKYFKNRHKTNDIEEKNTTHKE